MALQVDLESQLGEERLANEVETTVYRVIQEALTNIVKHAEPAGSASSCSGRTALSLAVVEDDGAGFDPAKLARTLSAWPACASASLSPADGSGRV